MITVCARSLPKIFLRLQRQELIKKRLKRRLPQTPKVLNQSVVSISDRSRTN